MTGKRRGDPGIFPEYLERIALNDRVRWRRCAMCHATIINSLVNAWDRNIDPHRIDAVAELVEIVNGRSTFYVARWDFTHDRIVIRDQFNIARLPPDAVIVLARHSCDIHRTGDLTWARPLQNESKSEANDDPPF